MDRGKFISNPWKPSVICRVKKWVVKHAGFHEVLECGLWKMHILQAQPLTNKDLTDYEKDNYVKVLQTEWFYFKNLWINERTLGKWIKFWNIFSRIIVLCYESDINICYYVIWFCQSKQKSFTHLRTWLRGIVFLGFVLVWFILRSLFF